VPQDGTRFSLSPFPVQKWFARKKFLLVQNSMCGKRVHLVLCVSHGSCFGRWFSAVPGLRWSRSSGAFCSKLVLLKGNKGVHARHRSLSFSFSLWFIFPQARVARAPHHSANSKNLKSTWPYMSHVISFSDRRQHLHRIRVKHAPPTAFSAGERISAGTN
jgi:hypothetical protein